MAGVNVQVGGLLSTIHWLDNCFSPNKLLITATSNPYVLFTLEVSAAFGSKESDISALR